MKKLVFLGLLLVLLVFVLAQVLGIPTKMGLGKKFDSHRSDFEVLAREMIKHPEIGVISIKNNLVAHQYVITENIEYSAFDGDKMRRGWKYKLSKQDIANEVKFKACQDLFKISPQELKRILQKMEAIGCKNIRLHKAKDSEGVEVEFEFDDMGIAFYTYRELPWTVHDQPVTRKDGQKALYEFFDRLENDWYIYQDRQD